MVQGTQVAAGAGQEEGVAGTLPEGAVRIDVAYAEKGMAKARGARWDPEVRSWYVPEGLDLDGFAEWLPVDLDAERESLGMGAVHGPQIEVALLGLRLPCWKCNRSTVSLVGLQHEEADVLLLDSELGKRVARAILPEPLRVSANVGKIDRRYSRMQKRRTLSNGCHWCDALQADHRLFAEDMAEVLSTGSKALEPLLTVDIPVDLWRQLEAAHEVDSEPALP